jgi:PAS domain S-box-containing protein
MPSKRLFSPLRDLNLHGKVLLMLAAVFALIALVFLAVLLPFQREQHARSLDQDRRLLSVLRDKHQRDLIHDLVSANHESLKIDLANLALESGILWVRLESGPVHPGAAPLLLEATGDHAIMRQLLENPEAQDGDSRAQGILLLDADGAADLIESSGQVLRAHLRIIPQRLPPCRSAASASELFQEVVWQESTALCSGAPLVAANENYGYVSILYSQAERLHAERRTRTIFYGVLGAAFILLAFLLNILLSRIVLGPVDRVMVAMRQSSKGELKVRLPVHSHDEIGAMAQSFNRMVEELDISKQAIEQHSQSLERKVAERTAELRASEETLIQLKNHLATVIANVAAGVVSLDDSSRITTFNGKAAEILGIRAEMALGRTLDDALASEETRALLEFLRPTRDAPPRSRQGQFKIKRPEGTQTLAIVATPLVGDGGRPMGTVVVFDDLTQILAHQRLEAWKEAVERVIHEIKNPLTPIGLSAKTLQTAHDHDRERFDAIFPSAVEMILTSVQDLKTLIAEFTQFSRLPEIRLERLDLNALVREVVAPFAVPPGVAIRSVAKSDSLEIEADRTQLRRVLLNVLNNAIESMEGRSGDIFVSTEGPTDTGHAALTIRDQGCGVEDVDRIFEPYYTTKVKGTGLGLAIARQIIAEHGGEIRARSKPGTGTTISIRLRVAPR